MQDYSPFNDTCCSVYSDEYMSSSGYTYYETRQQRRRAKNESGRSMVEMLGVLAVIGVLSVAGVAGFKTAMDKHRSNELMNEASKRAIIAVAQLAQGRTADQISLAEFTNNTISGATFATSAVVVGTSTDQFGIKVSNVEKSVCQNLVNMSGNKIQIAKAATPTAAMTASDCSDNKEQNVLAFIYNTDQTSQSCSTNRDCPAGQECSGGHCTNDGTGYDCTGWDGVPDGNVGDRVCSRYDTGYVCCGGEWTETRVDFCCVCGQMIENGQTKTINGTRWDCYSGYASGMEDSGYSGYDCTGWDGLPYGKEGDRVCDNYSGYICRNGEWSGSYDEFCCVNDQIIENGQSKIINGTKWYCNSGYACGMEDSGYSGYDSGYSGECLRDSDCMSGYWCESGSCVSGGDYKYAGECVENWDCDVDSGYWCECGLCIKGEAKTCRYEDDCQAGYACWTRFSDSSYRGSCIRSQCDESECINGKYYDCDSGIREWTGACCVNGETLYDGQSKTINGITYHCDGGGEGGNSGAGKGLLVIP